jgi:hypothetical protein
MSDKTISGTTSRKPLAQAESLLEASRLVDWRFLLPNPNLGQVAVTGNISASLRESLALFSESVSYLEAPFDDSSLQVDLLVIRGSLDGDLARTLAVVKPNASVYIEFSVRLNRFPFHHPLHSNIDVLKAHGFENIQAHWHSPNFEGCKRLIPLDNPDALAYILNKSEKPITRRLTRSAVFTVHRSGLLIWGTRSLSLIAQRGMS